MSTGLHINSTNFYLSGCLLKGNSLKNLAEMAPVSANANRCLSYTELEISLAVFSARLALEVFFAVEAVEVTLLTFRGV